MRLSIIIPVYNVVKFLSLCLDSLLNQDINSTDYEILIINDGSTDDSLLVANSYSNKHAHIKVHTKVNGGVGSARNKGITLAKGNYVYFIDPDDYLAKNVLKTILEQAENNKLDILTFISQSITDSSLYHSSSSKTGLELSNISNGENYIANHFYQNEVWWYVIKREFIEETKIKFIEGRWMEDAIFTAKLFLKADSMAYIPIDAHRHLIIEGSAMTNKEPSHYLKVIDDNKNAAMVFESLIKDLEQRNVNSECVNRLKIRQQSFVFFLMVRMLKSTISLTQAKKAIEDISINTDAYPLNAFPSNDYRGISYSVLTKLFNNKQTFYLLFRLFNPFLK